MPYQIDSRSKKNIDSLLPQARPLFTTFLEKLNAEFNPRGYTAKIISGHRTYTEQNELYAQGRTKKGPIVTNARGGYSNHNFGIAVDIGIFNIKDGGYLEESPLYDEAGAIGEKLGLEWGGRWTSIQDKPHFQIHTGLSLAQLRQRVEDGKSILKDEVVVDGWTVVGPGGGLLATGLPSGPNGTGLVRKIAEAYGGYLLIDGRTIKLKPAASKTEEE